MPLINPSPTARNALYWASGIKYPRLDPDAAFASAQRLNRLANMVAELRDELLAVMSRVRTSGATGASIDSWFSTMSVAVGSGSGSGSLGQSAPDA